MAKFGLSQINQPSPKAMKFFVNAFIILGGATAAVIAILPPKYMDNETKALVLQVGGILAGALKGVEKLTGTDSE